MFNMKQFENHVITLFEAIHPLDRVPRAGYLLRGVPEPESVAAHSHFLSLLVLLFVEEYPALFNRDKALIMAITHDLSEAKLMDIPMPIAARYLKEAKEHAEQAIFESLLSAFPSKYAEYHQELLDAKTPEARLVRALDKAQMMLKVIMYEREHRGRLDEFWQNPGNFNDFGLEQVAVFFDAICQRAGRVKPS